MRLSWTSFQPVSLPCVLSRTLGGVLCSLCSIPSVAPSCAPSIRGRPCVCRSMLFGACACSSFLSPLPCIAFLFHDRFSFRLRIAPTPCAKPCASGFCRTSFCVRGPLPWRWIPMSLSCKLCHPAAGVINEMCVKCVACATAAIGIKG